MNKPTVSRGSLLRVVVIEDRLEDAEQIISSLRNAGLAVRPARAESPQELEALLEKQPLDMVLADVASKTVAFADVAAMIKHSDKDVTLIATCREPSEAILLESSRAGASAVALSRDSEHVHTVVCEQLTALNNRRGLRRLEAALRESERRCDALIASSRDPIAYVHEGMHIRANDAYLEVFGYESFEDIEGLSILDMVAAGDVEQFKQLLKGMGKGEPLPRSVELHAQRVDGETFQAIMEFTPASFEGEDCLQIVFRQKLFDAEMVKELDDLRQKDPVTGLYNRQHFLQDLETVIAAAAEGQSDNAVLLIAPDNYTRLIADIGLDHADELLTELSARLTALLDDRQSAARFSDHMLAVLCRDSDHAASVALAERIREAISKRILEIGKRSFNVAVSLGGVQIGERVASLSQVLAKASECLQSATAAGGNRAVLFDPSADDRAEQEQVEDWLRRLRQALSGDGFRLYYQPIISLTGEPGEHYEALLRLKNEADLVVLPDNFLQIAEDNGLMPDIDRWVVAKAIETLAARRAAGHDTTLFVKITPSSLSDSRLLDLIVDRVRKYSLPGPSLVLQLQEAKVFTHLKASRQFQLGVAELGVRTALEQFGAGLNSFQLLEHFDPDFIKIDRSFMADLSKSEENQTRLQEIARRARDAGKTTVAEFVQDAASMTVLFSSGVDFVQGHFLAAASPEMNYDFSQ